MGRPNTDSDLAGTLVYMGTSSGRYGTPVDVGNVTTYTAGNLTARNHILLFRDCVRPEQERKCPLKRSEQKYLLRRRCSAGTRPLLDRPVSYFCSARPAPPVAVRDQKPDSHALGSWGHGPDFDPDLPPGPSAFEVSQGFLERRHGGQMERHMSDGFGDGFPLEKTIRVLAFPIPTPPSYSNCLVSPDTRIEPSGTRAWIANRQSEMPYCAEGKGNLHVRHLLVRKRPQPTMAERG